MLLQSNRNSWEDNAEALTEIQVEEKQVAKIKNNVQTVKNLLEVTTSSIKQTQMTSVNGYRGDECQNHAYAETESCESKRTSSLVRNPKLTARTRRRTKQRVENETNKAKIETKKGSEK